MYVYTKVTDAGFFFFIISDDNANGGETVGLTRNVFFVGPNAIDAAKTVKTIKTYTIFRVPNEY